MDGTLLCKGGDTLSTYEAMQTLLDLLQLMITLLIAFTISTKK